MKITFWNWWKEFFYFLPSIMWNGREKCLEISWLCFEVDFELENRWDF